MKKQLVIAWTIVLSLITWGCGGSDPLTPEENAELYGDVDSVSSAILGSFQALPPLPAVTSLRGFALTASADDGSARLGFMFTDATYRQTLLDSGAIRILGPYPYDGDNAYATYKVISGAWSAYEGRTTPQTYAFSELVVASNASYYTTNNPSYGGLISVIRNGGKGTYALTAAFTTRKAHSVTVPPGSSTLYSLAAQSGATGLTFSTFPIDQFGVVFPNFWTNRAVLAANAATVASPQVVPAGAKLAMSYLLGGNAVIRATDSPATVSSAANVPVIGGCTGAALADIAWTGTALYAACVSTSGVLVVKQASLANLAAVTWTTIATSVAGVVTALDLEANSTGVSLAIRVGTAVKVFKNVADASPTFDEVRPGVFDLARTANGLVLVIGDLAGDRILRTWLSP